MLSFVRRRANDTIGIESVPLLNTDYRPRQFPVKEVSSSCRETVRYLLGFTVTHFITAFFSNPIATSCRADSIIVMLPPTSLPPLSVTPWPLPDIFDPETESE